MNKTGGGPNTAEVLDEMDDKILDLMGGEIVIDGLVNIPEVGLPIEENVRTKDDDSLRLEGNNIYYILTEETENDELTRRDTNVEEEREEPEETTCAEKSKLNLRVKPPVNTIKNTPCASRQTAENKAAFDLVRVTEETNTIKENYYMKRLQIMQETLEIQKQSLEIEKQRLQVQERIAVGLELLVNK